MQNAEKLNDVVPRPPASFHNFLGFGAPEEQGVDDGSELNLDLSLGIGRATPPIFRSSSAAAAGKGANLSMVERSNSAPVKKHQVDPNPKPTRIPAWAGAHRKVEGSSSSETNTLAAPPHPATGTNKEKMAGIVPTRKRGRATKESTTEITKAMPRVYSNGVEGILYKYTSKHNISIVCLCHGELHTPAEFVRHSGGGNVPNPMRCITVISDQRRRPSSNPIGKLGD